MNMIVPQTNFVIEDIIYYPTRNHMPVQLRPYVFSSNAESLGTLSDRLEQSKSGSVTPSLLSGLAGGLIQPSTVGFDSSVNVGWVGTRRFIFMMKVRYVYFTGVEMCVYVFGYTEYDGITPQGNINTEMAHYINNVIETSTVTTPTPMGMRRMEKLASIYNAIYSTSQQDLYTQRPVDIYQTYAANEMAGYMDIDASFSNASSIISPFSKNIVTSTTENCITTEYLSKILSSGMQSMKSREVVVSAYNMGSHDPVEKFFTEPSMTECEFIRTLGRLGGFRGVSGTFNMKALMCMDPTVIDRFKLFNLTADFSNPLLTNTPEVGEYWGGQDMVTTKAYSLIENAVGMATKYGFTKLSFIVSNMMDVLGGVNYSILDFKSFLSLSQQDTNYILEVFKDKFNIEVYLNETQSGRISLHMECHVDILGTSKIYLEYAGFPGTWYTIPTFANSLFAPVVTNDQALVELAAGHVGASINTLLGNEPVTYY